MEFNNKAKFEISKINYLLKIKDIELSNLKQKLLDQKNILIEEVGKKNEKINLLKNKILSKEIIYKNIINNNLNEINLKEKNINSINIQYNVLKKKLVIKKESINNIIDSDSYDNNWKINNLKRIINNQKHTLNIKDEIIYEKSLKICKLEKNETIIK